MSDASDLALMQVIKIDNDERENRRRAELGLAPLFEPDRPRPVIPKGFALPCRVHLVGPTPVWPGRLEDYGDETMVTVEDLAGLADRNGRCSLLELIADEDAQILRWGRICVKVGPWPADQPACLPGSEQWDLLRSQAFSDARLISHLPDRQAAIVAARQKFGAEFGRPPARVTNAAYGLAGLAV